MKDKSSLLLLLFTTAALSVIALYNGFPLVDGDTGAYIEQAIYPHFPPDRTPFYSFFLRASSLRTSLWFTVFAQCSLLAFVLLRYIQLLQRRYGAGIGRWKMSAVSVVTIISFTCVSWTASSLLPDVFSAILLLALLLYLNDDTAGRITRWVYIALLFLALTMHNSNFAALLLCSVILLLYAWRSKELVLKRRSAVLIGTCAAFYFMMCGANAMKHHGFVYSRATNIMITAKLAETGILKTYLDEHCGESRLQHCNYRKAIPPSVSAYLWSGESPLYKVGGWDSSASEYSGIVRAVFTTPRCLRMYVQKTAISTLKQLVLLQPPTHIAPVTTQGSETRRKISDYFTDELGACTTSLQNTDVLDAAPCDIFYYLFFILSAIWVLWRYPQVMTGQLRSTYCIILLYLVCNALVIAALTTVTDRFQYRISWLLPATNAIVIIRYYWERYHRQKALPAS